MKFVNPELEVTLFSVEDILTTSGGGETANPREETVAFYVGRPCVGNDYDMDVANCL